MATAGDPNHPSGHAHEVMTRGNGRGTAAHHGKRCTRLRALTADDPNPAFRAQWDVRAAHTVVQLDSGEEVVLSNDEIGG
jgi:hypothetical protein